MDEKVYKTLNSTGKLNIIFGILTIVFMLGAGIVFIVNGARAVAVKNKMIF